MKKLQDGFTVVEDKYTTITPLGKFKDLDPLGKETMYYYDIVKDFASPEDEVLYVKTYFGPLAGSGDLYLKNEDGKFTYGVGLWIS